MHTDKDTGMQEDMQEGKKAVALASLNICVAHPHISHYFKLPQPSRTHPTLKPEAVGRVRDQGGVQGRKHALAFWAMKDQMQLRSGHYNGIYNAQPHRARKGIGSKLLF